MQTILIDLATNFWDLLTSIAVYILLGVILAGVFKQFLPDSFIRRHLGGKTYITNIKAAIIGIPLPLCSCSVIPFVSALKKSGASKSSIQTFLIATPITGADSILATYGVMGWAFTIYRTISSVVISLFAGFLSLIFVKEDTFSNDESKSKNTNATSVGKVSALDNDSSVKSLLENNSEETSSCCASANKAEPVQSSACCPSNAEPVDATGCCSSAPEPEETSGCCATSTTSVSTNGNTSIGQTVKDIFIYAFDDIYKDIAKSMMIGIALGAVIMTFMPANMSEYLSDNLLLNYVLILLIAMPLYVCATSSVPMGIALLIGGFSPGAVFIFLTAGPATNAVTMSVVHKTLGKQSLIIYLASILIGSLVFAVIMDVFFVEMVKDIMAMTHEEEVKGFIEQISGVIMLYLSFKYMFVKNASIASGSCGGGCASEGCSS